MDGAAKGRWGDAARDLSDGVSRVWLWSALGKSDVRRPHSGSILGSFWITSPRATAA